jgi:hypothetical protein
LPVEVPALGELETNEDLEGMTRLNRLGVCDEGGDAVGGRGSFLRANPHLEEGGVGEEANEKQEEQKAEASHGRRS